MLVEEGFEVVSVDASDKMLKYALKERWNRRHEKGFDKWGMSVNLKYENKKQEKSIINHVNYIDPYDHTMGMSNLPPTYTAVS